MTDEVDTFAPNTRASEVDYDTLFAAPAPVAPAIAPERDYNRRQEERAAAAQAMPPMTYPQLIDSPTFRQSAYAVRVDQFEEWMKHDFPRLAQGFTPEQVAASEKNTRAAFARQNPKPSSNVLRDWSAGAVSTVLDSTAGLTNLISPNNAVGNAIEAAAGYVGDLKSRGGREDDLAFEQRMAGADSEWERAKIAAQDWYYRPVQNLVEGVAGAAPVIAGSVAAAASVPATGGASAGVAAAVAGSVLGGAQALGDYRSNRYKMAQNLSLAQLKENAHTAQMLAAGMTEEQVRDTIGREIGLGGLVAAGAGSLAFGGIGSAITRKAGLMPFTSRAIAAAEGSAFGVLDAVGETVGTNISAMEFDPNVNYYDGISGAVINGAMVGGALTGGTFSNSSARANRQVWLNNQAEAIAQNPQRAQQVIAAWDTNRVRAIDAFRGKLAENPAEAIRAYEETMLAAADANTPEGTYILSQARNLDIALRDVDQMRSSIDATTVDPDVHAEAMALLAQRESELAYEPLVTVAASAQVMEAENPTMTPARAYDAALDAVVMDEATRTQMRAMEPYRRGREEYIRTSDYSRRVSDFLGSLVGVPNVGNADATASMGSARLSSEIAARLDQFAREHAEVINEPLGETRSAARARLVEASSVATGEPAPLDYSGLMQWIGRKPLSFLPPIRPEDMPPPATRRNDDGETRASTGRVAAGNAGDGAAGRPAGESARASGADNNRAAQPPTPRARGVADVAAGVQPDAVGDSQAAQADAVRRLGQGAQDAGRPADGSPTERGATADQLVRGVAALAGDGAGIAGSTAEAAGGGRRSGTPEPSDRPATTAQRDSTGRDSTPGLDALNAMDNLRNNVGTAWDVADVIRIYGREGLPSSMPTTGREFRDGLGLSMLSDEAYSMARSDPSMQDAAVAVGQEVADKGAHAAILREIIKEPVASRGEAQLLARRSARAYQDAAPLRAAMNAEFFIPLTYRHAARAADTAAGRTQALAPIARILADQPNMASRLGMTADAVGGDTPLSDAALAEAFVRKLAMNEGPVGDALDAVLVENPGASHSRIAEKFTQRLQDVLKDNKVEDVLAGRHTNPIVADDTVVDSLKADNPAHAQMVDFLSPEDLDLYQKRYAALPNAHKTILTQAATENGFASPDALVQATMVAGEKTKLWTSLSARVRRIINTLRKGLLASVAAISVMGAALFTPYGGDARAASGVGHYVPTQEATLGGGYADAVNAFVQQNADHGGRPYLIADKATGRLHLMDVGGNIIESTPALFGKDVGDARKPGQTPSGVFNLQRVDGGERYGGDVQAFAQEGNNLFAIHRVLLDVPGQERGARLERDDMSRRISLGCINLPEAFYDRYMQSDFGGRLYVVPDTPAAFEAMTGQDAGRGAVPQAKPARAAAETIRPVDVTMPFSPEWVGEESGEPYVFTPRDFAGIDEAVRFWAQQAGVTLPDADAVPAAQTVGSLTPLEGALAAMGVMGVARNNRTPTDRRGQDRDSSRGVPPPRRREDSSASGGDNAASSPPEASAPPTRPVVENTRVVVEATTAAIRKAALSIEKTANDYVKARGATGKVGARLNLEAQQALKTVGNVARGIKDRAPENIEEYMAFLEGGAVPTKDVRQASFKRFREKFIDAMAAFNDFLHDTGRGYLRPIYDRSRNKASENIRVVDAAVENTYRTMSLNARKHGLSNDDYVLRVNSLLSAQGALDGNPKLLKKALARQIELGQRLIEIEDYADASIDSREFEEFRRTQKEFDDIRNFVEGYNTYAEVVRTPDNLPTAFAKHHAKNTRFAGALTNAEARLIIDTLGTTTNEAALASINADADAMRALLRTEVERGFNDGLFSDAEYNEWSQNEHYVPQTGFSESLPDVMDTRWDMSGGIREQERMGRTSAPETPLAAIIKQARTVARERGMMEFNSSLLADAEQGGEGGRIGVYDYAEDVSDAYAIRTRHVNRDGVEEVVRRKIVIHNDPDAQAALTGANITRELKDDPTWQRLSRKFVGGMSWMVTVGKPAFGPINAFRDTLEVAGNIAAMGLAGRGIKPARLHAQAMLNLKNALSGAGLALHQENLGLHGAEKLGGVIAGISRAVGRDVDTWANDFHELRSLGGISTRTRAMRGDFQAQAEEIAKLSGLRGKGRSIANGVAHYNHWFEGAAKLAVFRALKDQGVDPQTASTAVLRAMDFNQRGTNVGLMAALYPFYSTRMVGASNIYRSLRTPAGLGLFSAKVLAGYALYEAARALGGDDDLLGDKTDNINENTVQRSIPLWVGDEYLKIPVPYGDGMLAWNLAVGLSRWTRGAMTASDVVEHAAAAAVDELSIFGTPPPADMREHPGWYVSRLLIPEALKRFTNVVAGRNDFGGELNNRYISATEPRAGQGKASTPKFWHDAAKTVGGVIDLTPEEVQELAGYVLPDAAVIVRKADRGAESVLGSTGSAIAAWMGSNRLSGEIRDELGAVFYREFNRWQSSTQDAVRQWGAIPTHRETGVRDVMERINIWQLENGVPEEVARRVKAVYLYNAQGSRKGVTIEQRQRQFLESVLDENNYR